MCLYYILDMLMSSDYVCYFRLCLITFCFLPTHGLFSVHCWFSAVVFSSSEVSIHVIVQYFFIHYDMFSSVTDIMGIMKASGIDLDMIFLI